MSHIPPPIPPRPPGYETSEPPSLPPTAVTACIDNHVSFATDWYWHLEAPEFFICSRCYVDHIHATLFEREFQSNKFSDGKPRICRFSKPRMKDHLWKDALASRKLEPAIDWMRHRSSIPDCKGVDGVKGNDAAALSIRWYSPGTWVQVSGSTFLACEACYEDNLMTNQLSCYFSLFQKPQPSDAVWVCDMAMPYMEKEYEAKGTLGDWQGFVQEAKARLLVPPCPKGTEMASYGRNWFVPKAAPESGLVLCQACFVDQVLHSGEEDKWEASTQLSSGLDRTYRVRCARGAMFNISVLFSAAHEKKDFSLFWKAIDKLGHEKPCEADGIAGGRWYTLPSHPKNFGVCAACYVAILEPLQVSRFWVPMSVSNEGDAASETKLLCCLNRNHSRLSAFFLRLYEMYVTLDPKALDVYASDYASVPLCPRDTDVPNRHWYGWLDCTICPECYLDFARNSPLAEIMDLRDTLQEGSTMCELYSPRMRSLYSDCSTSPPSPASLKPLLSYSIERRLVYLQTIPQIRMMLFQQRLALQQQQFLNVTSTHYKAAGQMEQTMYGTPYTYSAPGLGSGYANMNALQGAAYEKQALEVVATAGAPSQVLMVGELERRWRAVE